MQRNTTYGEGPATHICATGRLPCLRAVTRTWRRSTLLLQEDAHRLGSSSKHDQFSALLSFHTQSGGAKSILNRHSVAASFGIGSGWGKLPRRARSPSSCCYTLGKRLSFLMEAPCEQTRRTCCRIVFVPTRALGAGSLSPPPPRAVAKTFNLLLQAPRATSTDSEISS